MIRPKVKEIVKNIDKFEYKSFNKYKYQNMTVDTFWGSLYIEGGNIKLSFMEKRYLFKAFKEAEKSYLKQQENDLLNSINFDEDKK